MTRKVLDQNKTGWKEMQRQQKQQEIQEEEKKRKAEILDGSQGPKVVTMTLGVNRGKYSVDALVKDTSEPINKTQAHEGEGGGGGESHQQPRRSLGRRETRGLPVLRKRGRSEAGLMEDGRPSSMGVTKRELGLTLDEPAAKRIKTMDNTKGPKATECRTSPSCTASPLERLTTSTYVCSESTDPTSSHQLRDIYPTFNPATTTPHPSEYSHPHPHHAHAGSQPLFHQPYHSQQHWGANPVDHGCPSDQDRWQQHEHFLPPLPTGHGQYTAPGQVGYNYNATGIHPGGQKRGEGEGSKSGKKGGKGETKEERAKAAKSKDVLGALVAMRGSSHVGRFGK